MTHLVHQQALKVLGPGGPGAGSSGPGISGGGGPGAGSSGPGR